MARPSDSVSSRSWNMRRKSVTAQRRAEKRNEKSGKRWRRLRAVRDNPSRDSTLASRRSTVRFILLYILMVQLLLLLVLVLIRILKPSRSVMLRRRMTRLGDAYTPLRTTYARSAGTAVYTGA